MADLHIGIPDIKCDLQGSHKVLKILEFGTLKFKYWKTLKIRHFLKLVLEKCLNYF